MPGPLDDQNDTSDTAGESPESLESALGAGDTEFVYSEDKKPAGKSLLVLVGAIALAAGGLYLMNLRTGPAKAAASAEVESAQKTITQFLAAGTGSTKAVETMLQDTEKVVQQFLAYPMVTQIPLDDLKTNPFRHQGADKPAPSADAAAAAERKRLEEERAKVLAAVQSLELNSILHSDKRRACMINNTFFLEGQTVQGFQIEKINPGSVIVKSGAYRFELRMQQ
jgi:hypothetical protein